MCVLQAEGATNATFAQWGQQIETNMQRRWVSQHTSIVLSTHRPLSGRNAGRSSPIHTGPSSGSTPQAKKRCAHLHAFVSPYLFCVWLCVWSLCVVSVVTKGRRGEMYGLSLPKSNSNDSIHVAVLDMTSPHCSQVVVWNMYFGNDSVANKTARARLLAPRSHHTTAMATIMSS